MRVRVREKPLYKNVYEEVYKNVDFRGRIQRNPHFYLCMCLSMRAACIVFVFFNLFYDLYVLCNQVRTKPITRLAIAIDMATSSLYAQELGSQGPRARAPRPVPQSLSFDVQAPPKLGPNAPQCPCHVTRIPGQGIPGPRNRSPGALGCTWFLQFPGTALNPGLYLPMSCT